jgi:hypothetical protein
MRNIEHIEFWKVDAEHRRIGVREAPDYDLARAKEAIAGVLSVNAIDDILNEANK